LKIKCYLFITISGIYKLSNAKNILSLLINELIFKKNMINNKILIWNNSNSVLLLKESLEKNNACVGTGDTVLGLLANTTSAGFEKLNEIKKRFSKSYIVLVNDICKLPLFVQIDFSDKKLMTLIKEIWPGPVTLIFKSKTNLPNYLKSLDNTIAIRIPKHPGLLQLLTFFDGLFSTSANLSGEKIPESLDEIDFHIVNLVEYIILDSLEQNYRYPVVPSTILDCTQSKIKVIRQGIVPLDKLENIYGEKFEK